MADYHDKLLDHDVDGIKEYDNPMPGWLLAMLWGALLFGILYLGYYGLSFGTGAASSQYRDEAIAKRAEVQAYFDKHPIVPPAASALLAGAKSPEVLAKAQARFLKTCAPCHGEAAQGIIGPNLTDDSWLHGGQVLQIFSTIAKGVPAKGMPTWGRAIPAEELAGLVSYIRSLQGSNPPNAKPPEGMRVEPEPLP